MTKHSRAWLTKREIFRLNQYSVSELRDRLAAAIVIARRYSRECDALRKERDQLERDATGLAAELGELQSWYLAAMQAGRVNAELATSLRAEAIAEVDWLRQENLKLALAVSRMTLEKTARDSGGVIFPMEGEPTLLAIAPAGYDADATNQHTQQGD